jgi:hypothetical protein
VPDAPPEHVDLAVRGLLPTALTELETALAEAGMDPSEAISLLLIAPRDALGWVPLLAGGVTTVAELVEAQAWLEPAQAAPFLRAGWSVREAAELVDAVDPADGWDGTGWRATGLPATTVAALLVRRPLLRPADLGVWADGGVDAELLAAVLHADPATSPDEWTAFATSGLSEDVALDWLANGFDVAQALAWEAVDVVPCEARVWRGQGLRAADVAGRARSGDEPVLPEGGWAGWGSDRRSRVWMATDPPGTRGRIAAEQAGRG